MANCRVVNPVTLVCSDLLQASGVDKNFYVGYCSDLSIRFSLLQTAPIAAITFIPYNGLVRMEGAKFAHKFDSELMVAPGGNVSYTHKGMVKLMPSSTQDDVEIQRMTQAQDMFIVNVDNNENIFIYAPSKGFQAVAGPLRTTGQAAGEDVATTLNFISNEKVLPLRFTLGGTHAADITYLDSLIR
jgi:hypothetical protein